MMRWLILVPLLALAPRTTPSLAGDWDVYIALSAQPKLGFEGWRRMGFAHFAGSRRRAVRRRAAADALPAGAPRGGAVVGVARLHLRGAARAGPRPVERRCGGLRRLHYRYQGRVRRRRVGGETAGRQRQGRDD